MTIDTSFHFRDDTPAGKDPDKASPTLRRYHQLLWSKPLPDGRRLELSDTSPGVYLHHRSADVGELRLTSDAAIQTFNSWARMRPILDQMEPGENDEFVKVSYTIGGMLVFPGNRVGRAMTINGARGFIPAIADRVDLTLECIHRHYRHDDNTPLGSTLRRYADFFALFGDFDGYVDFFHLQDLTDRGTVKFFTDVVRFDQAARPTDLATYREFRTRSLEFVHARNRRIAALNL